MLDGGQRIQQKWILFAIVAFSAVIMFAALPAKSFWLDETFTASVTPQKNELLSPAQVVQLSRVINDRRPPLYFFLVYYWALVAGNSEFAIRFPSVFFSLLSICLLARLTKSLKLPHLAPLAAAILALSPTFVLYSRMARPFSMPVCVGLLSTILFIELLRRPSRGLWIGYVAVAAVLLYTDYVLWVLLLAQNMYALYRAAKRALPLRQWLVGQVIAFVLFIPGLAILVRQPSTLSGEADLGGGPLGLVIKIVYQVYSAFIGETILPWRPVAIAGLLCAAIAALLGIVTLVRHDQARLAIFLFALSLPACDVVFSILASGMSFIYVPSHSLFLLPFFSLLLAAGIASMRARPWRLLISAILALAWGVGLYNYFANQDFMNPVYIMPSREVTEQIVSEAKPGDVIVSEYDAIIGYYFEHSALQPPQVTYLDLNYAGDTKTVRDQITTARSPRVWLVTLGRDQTRRMSKSDQFTTWLETDYRLEESRGYAKQDALYRTLKERLTKRPDYEYKLLVELYLRK